MNLIKVLLVDDEYLALNLIENFIKDIPDLEIIAKTKSPIEAIDILNTNDIDLLFLDVQMPVLSGINLLKTLKNKPVTIFTTAYSEFAVDAFGLDAVDYLLKPFSFERFLQAINKAKEQLKRNTSSHSLETNEHQSESFLTIKSDGKLIKIFHIDILYIEGLKEYVRFVTPKEKHITLMSLRELIEVLPDRIFLRCHKSYIVNSTKVKSVEGNLLHIEDYKIPISRDKKQAILERIFHE